MTLQFRLPANWLLYLLASLIVLLALVTIVGERGALHLWRLRGEKTQLDEQNYRLQKTNEELRQRIARIRNDNRYLEKLAREELNLVRPGEVVYRFSKAEPRASRAGGVIESASGSPPSVEQR
ncbi:MAG: FtsB family cell division protein [Candidatus Binatia bacterium]